MKINQLLFLALCLITVSCTPKKEADKKADTYEVVNPILKDTTYSNEYVAEIQSEMVMILKNWKPLLLSPFYQEKNKHVSKII